jgi:hypothetical protein
MSLSINKKFRFESLINIHFLRKEVNRYFQDLNTEKSNDHL